MIIFDYSNVVVANILATIPEKDLAKPTKLTEGLARHTVLNTILQAKTKYKEYGDVVIACDGRNYWRKGVFPYYKGTRKEARDKSSINWDFIFQVSSELKNELRENYPYSVIEVEGAEADDVMASLVKFSQTHELVQEGIFTDEPQPVLLYSNDTDMIQLQRYSNVKQYAPAKKKEITVPGGGVDAYLLEHICTGDVGDGIPNICSPENSLVDKIRQKPFRRSRLEKGLDALLDTLSEEELKRFATNRTLIDFEFIPNHVYNSVILEYLEPVQRKSVNKIMAHLLKFRLNALMEDIHKF